MMLRRSLLRIDDSRSRRRRVALQQRTSILACAGSPSIDLIDIIPELTGSPTLCGSSVTMMVPLRQKCVITSAICASKKIADNEGLNMIENRQCLERASESIVKKHGRSRQDSEN